MGLQRQQITVSGIVQGVGFRPFVFRLAGRLDLSGWVCNTPAGVIIEVQGPADQLSLFTTALTSEAPPLAVVDQVTAQPLPVIAAETSFTIRPSSSGEHLIQIAPDGDLCPDCLRELFDPADRRFRHPFITCTNCGPRYSIIASIPYDRPRTTMAPFPFCPDCAREYADPMDRRFHAQPVACPACGPTLSLVDGQGTMLPDDPITAAAALLRAGKIVAVKGVGGFHLAADAWNDVAVAELRRRKRRSDKPFAVMVADLEHAAELVELDDLAARLLTVPERPIVILKNRDQGLGTGDQQNLTYGDQGLGTGKKPNSIAPSVAPGNGYLGVMLPVTPVQHLLLAAVGQPLVMTSGNVADEPIAIGNEEALTALGQIADAFLLHNREILVRCDDSVLRVFRGNPLFYRRARGYTPRMVRLPAAQPAVLAVGAELKGSICLTRGSEAFPSQHLGDLQHAATMDVLAATSRHLQQLLEITPTVVAHDLHPDFLSTHYAEGLGLPCFGVQHHHAHLAACLAEHQATEPAIGVIFDGTGLGPDGTVWGGEFLIGDYRAFRRAGHFRQVPLPGGDAAIREPRRMALAYLFDSFGADFGGQPLPPLADLSPDDLALYRQILAKRLNAPLTSSCGRLFDAVAALLGIRQTVSYEGQAAIELEALAETAASNPDPLPFTLGRCDDCWELDFRPTITALVAAVAHNVSIADLALAFHRTLAVATLAVCDRLRQETGLHQVALSGGVFQNRLLTEELAMVLETAGFTVLVQRLLPPNDGCIALGQAVVVGQQLQSTRN